MYLFFGPPPFLIPVMGHWYVLFVVQSICLLLLGTASALLLTTSYVYLSYQVMKPKSGGSEEVAASIFIFLEGFSCSIAPLLCGWLLNVLPTSHAPNCFESRGDIDCVTSFPTLMFVLSGFMLVLITISAFSLWKIDYAWGPERKAIISCERLNGDIEKSY